MMEEKKPTSGVDLIKNNPLEQELYFLIAQFLRNGPCAVASQVLIQEIEKNEIIPKSLNWLGEEVSQDFKTFSSKFSHVTSQHLPHLLEQLLKITSTKDLVSSQASRSLLSLSTLNASFACGSNGKYKSSGLLWSRRFRPEGTLAVGGRRAAAVQSVVGREVTGSQIGHSLLPPDFFQKMDLCCSRLGHLCAGYCVCFDMSGLYVFTGADDHLVKIWSAIDGRLIYTIRGTQSEIVDFTVNLENTMIAVASREKAIKVWCLKTGAPIASLSTQGGSPTSIHFCPMPRSRSSVQYLASTSTDGSCAFWAYTEEPGEHALFQPKPTLYLEKMRPGKSKMLCSSFSRGGLFMASGSADNHVRVYHMLGTDGPERILEVEHHSDQVDSISWAHEGLRFVSGSKDGTALIWRFENGCWRYVRLHCSKIPGEASTVYDDPRRRPKVTMIGWNSDDSLVLTGVSDCIIRVWNSKTGELLRVLKEHTLETYVIESHPFNPRLLCTASHDGKIVIWDIGTTQKNSSYGIVYKQLNNLEEGQGYESIFDCKWSPDGFSLAAVGSHGHMIILGMQGKKNKKFGQIPNELFFHTDYRPISRDAITQEILDEQTQVAPHVMPPPFLVDVDGNPYPPASQRFVPGREGLQDSHLIPNVAVSERGHQEIIEGLPQVPQPIPPPPPPPLASPNQGPRLNIDDMIQQLAIEQGLERDRQRHAAGERRGVANRRSGEVEGVRQSRGNWDNSTPATFGFSKRARIIPPLTGGTLVAQENTRLGFIDAEEKWYHEQLDKYPSPNASADVAAAVGAPPSESTAVRSRRIRRQAAQAAETRQLRRNDQENFSQLEGVARPNPRPQLEISVSQESPRRQLQPPRAGPPSRNGGNNSRRRVRYDVLRILRENGNDFENLDPSSSEAEVEMDSDSGSSSSSSSDSDWGGNLGSGRRRRENEHSDSPPHRSETGTGRKRTVVKNEASSNDENDDVSGAESGTSHSGNPKPGPSTEITSKIKTEPMSSSKPSRPRKARGKVDYTEEEVDPRYRPSEWLSELIPQRSPYFPQIGDDLVYLRQGHEAYIKYVEDNNLYQIPKKMKTSLPYIHKPDLEAEVSVRVVGIKFEQEPPRVAVLKLARTDWNNKELIRNEYFYVKYHDVENVVDFLILRQMYDKSIRRRWNEGDRFRCLIGREWWIGTVIRKEAFGAQFPRSHYWCYKVKWDNGDPETMSPWDIETIPDDFVIPAAGKDGIPASDEDMRLGLYESSIQDWPPHGHQDALCQKLSSLVEEVMQLAIAEAFLTPVDLNLYPDYAICIEYPVDLSTIKARLDNRFYRRMDALKFDFTYIAMNAEKFNEKGSDIVKNARIVGEVCAAIVNNPDMPSITPIYQKISKNAPKAEEHVENKKPKSHKAASTSTAKTPSKSTQESSKMQLRGRHSEDENRSWQEQCMELLNDIYHKKDAQPFREAVDIIGYPNYYQVIDTPMDLGSVREDLLGRNYRTGLHFHKDMMLIFSNAKQYNVERSPIYAMTLRLQSLYECRMKPLLTKWRKKSGSSSSNVRYMTRGASGTPRKTLNRNATRERAQSQDHLSTDEDISNQVAQERRLRSREQKWGKGKRLNEVNGHTSRVVSEGSSGRRLSSGRIATSRTNGTVSPSRNSTESSGGSSGRPRRMVKRLRISSSRERESSRSPRRSTFVASTPTKTSPRKKVVVKQEHNGTETHRASPRKQKMETKKESDSDEFEDSDYEGEGNMPVLDKEDEDYELSGDDNEDGDYSGRRRSDRVKKKKQYDEVAYETRHRGQKAKNYAEYGDGSEDDDESNHNHNTRKRRTMSDSSPSRMTRGHLSEPPVLKRPRMRNIDEDSDNENDHFNANQPGTSSRLLRTSHTETRSPIRNVLEDEDEEEEDDGEVDEESEESDEQNSEDESEEDEAAGKKKRPQRRRRPLRQRQIQSEDEGGDEPQRKGPSRKARKRVVYNEDEDSESDHPTTTITVSQRGRIRKTRTCSGD